MFLDDGSHKDLDENTLCTAALAPFQYPWRDVVIRDQLLTMTNARGNRHPALLLSTLSENRENGWRTVCIDGEWVHARVESWEEEARRLRMELARAGGRT